MAKNCFDLIRVVGPTAGGWVLCLLACDCNRYGGRQCSLVWCVLTCFITSMHKQCLLAGMSLAGGGDLVRQRASPFDVTRPSSAKHNMDYYSMFSATSPILQDVALLAVLRCGGAL